MEKKMSPWSKYTNERKSQARYKRRCFVGICVVFLCLLIIYSRTNVSVLEAPDDFNSSQKSGTNRLWTFPWRTDSTLSDEKHQGTKKFPQALLIGAKKSGTRALLEFIRVHPNVRAAGHEVHYFDKNYDRGPEWYREMMPTSIHGQITIEKTPSYMVTKEAPERVFQMNKSMKLIVVLKDPVERAISDYTQSNTKHHQKKSFEASVFKDLQTLEVNESKPSINIGLYSNHLKRWLQWFPLKQFCFISGENLIKEPAMELEKLQRFLNLKIVITQDHFYYNSTKGFPCLKKREASGVPHCLGEGKGRVHPKVSSVAKNALYEYYEPYNQELYEMTGIDFQWGRGRLKEV